MRNFQLYNPIKMIFGPGQFDRLGEVALEYGSKPLLVVGKNFAREGGLLDRAIELLTSQGMDPVVFEGIEPNPRVTTLRDAAKLAQENECDLIIGIGGGSVMDASKVIAFGFHDPDGIWKRIAYWNEDYTPIDQALPIVLASTLAATGSEGDAGAVITNWETHEKVGVFSVHMFPKVSIIDPELTVSVNPEYTRDGAIDMMIHVLESYLNGDEWATFSDRVTESLMAEVILALESVMENPSDIDARGKLSYLGAVALQGFINGPRGGVFPLHMMEHPLSGLYDISHGRGLAMLLPRWLSYVSRENPDKIIQIGERVFALDLETFHPFEAADKTIKRIIDWLEEIGSWYFADDLGIPNDPVIFRKLAEDVIRLNGNEEGVIGGIRPLGVDDIVAIYQACVRTGTGISITEESVEEIPSETDETASDETEEEIEIVEEVIVIEEGDPIPEGDDVIVIEEVIEEVVEEKPDSV
ncbi:MAG: iron-containing alcohol dehydrogenase [bacterium]